jgi:hypothetical protein
MGVLNMNNHLIETKIDLNVLEASDLVGRIARAIAEAGEGSVRLSINTREAGYTSIAAYPARNGAPFITSEGKLISQRVVDPATYQCIALNIEEV